MEKKFLSYCGELVRTSEPDLFLLSMFSTASVREDLWTLFAFYHEISKTRHVVSETTLGLIRLQWWRDAVAKLYEGEVEQGHEVLKPLSDVVFRHDLPQESFEKLIYAREFDLENVSPGNIEGLLNYCDFTTTGFFEMAVQIMGDDPADYIIQPIAMNYTLMRALKAAPYYAKDGWLILPEDLCMQNDVTLENFFEFPDRLSDVIRKVIDHAPENVPVDHVFLKGAQALSQIYLKQIKRNDFNILSEKLRVDPPFKVLKLFCKTKLL